MIGRTLGRPGLRFGWGFTSCAFVCSGFLRGRPRFFGSGALSLPGKASSKAASSSPSHFSRRFQYSSSTCGRLSRGALRLRQHVLSESMTSPNVALSSTPAFDMRFTMRDVRMEAMRSTNSDPRTE